jgi:hypothetical protein
MLDVNNKHLNTNPISFCFQIGEPSFAANPSSWSSLLVQNPATKSEDERDDEQQAGGGARLSTAPERASATSRTALFIVQA